MTDLSTEYMGLKLKNPIIVASSGLTGNIKGITNVAEAGAGAVVLESLFEEDIEIEVGRDEGASEYFTHPEAGDYIHQMGMLLKPDNYINMIEEVKSKIDIPVIASLNCISPQWWNDYAERIENVKADALELNVAIMASQISDSPREIEKRIIKIVDKVSSKVSIPVSVKIGQNFSSLPHLTHELYKAGASAIVLFNRFYRPDIDIDKMKMITGQRFSSQEELTNALRWTGVLSDLVDCDIAASTGIHEGSDVIKVIMAGANAAYVCSTLYKNGMKQISKMLKDIEVWMESKGYTNIQDFYSKLSLDDDVDKAHYQRLQYVKALRYFK